MDPSVAIVGAGVSGLTCGVVFAERGYRTAIFAKETGKQTTSGAAAAVWFPYDARPARRVIPWALETYQVLADLARMSASFRSGFALAVPLMDTTIYLDYLANHFIAAGGSISSNVRLEKLEDVDSKFDLVINCAGIGARELVHDRDLEPHRGQVAVVPRVDGLSCAIVCDDAPLMYAIPRTNDCVFGGTNEISDNLAADPVTTSKIVGECSRVLSIESPRLLSERVGLRPFRKSGVRLESDRLCDGRAVIHNYGHGGAGFTLSWGCAREVLETTTL
ncbi:MAG: hypothetical protein DME56_13520 [Verrucomicrobia bacterium]|nr:MAG: hypothetical protein DME56_13520 [Verrucomicrobiota bacterium]